MGFTALIGNGSFPWRTRILLSTCFGTANCLSGTIISRSFFAVLSFPCGALGSSCMSLEHPSVPLSWDPQPGWSSHLFCSFQDGSGLSPQYFASFYSDAIFPVMLSQMPLYTPFDLSLNSHTTVYGIFMISLYQCLLLERKLYRRRDLCWFCQLTHLNYENSMQHIHVASMGHGKSSSGGDIWNWLRLLPINQ